MITILLVLTLANFLLLGALALHLEVIRVSFKAVRTHVHKVLLGFEIRVNNRRWYISVRNNARAILREDIEYLRGIKPQARHQQLHARLSWIDPQDTLKLEKFRRDWRSADPEFVDKIVRERSAPKP